MITLCTLFDARYMAKGLSLIASLRRHVPDFALYVLCLDDQTRDHFDTTIPGVIPITLPEIESHELAYARGNRTPTEYIWTLGSYFTSWCAENYNPPSLAYIDADCYLFGDLAPLYDEVEDAPIAITPHRYTPYQEPRLRGAGRFNVGWTYFSRAGYPCLREWSCQCLEWCKWNVEKDGRFADQGYLNSWDKQWGAHVVYNIGINLAPWNQEQYEYWVEDNKLIVSDGRRADELLLYHFHGFTSDTNGKVIQRTGYPLNEMVTKYVYEPYELEILKASSVIQP